MENKGEMRWRSDLKRVFESFQQTYIEDAKDQAKIDGEDEYLATQEFEVMTYDAFEKFIFDYIAEFFEQNESGAKRT